MTDTELKELIEDCCNEIANKIEPLANVKARLYTSLKPAINYTRCCKSDSELLKIPKTTKKQRVQLNEGYNKK